MITPKTALTNLLSALSPLTIMGKPIAELDSDLSHAITEAVQSLTLTAEESVVHLVAREIAIGVGDNPDREGARLTGYDEAARRVLDILRDKPEPPPENMAVCIGCGTHPKGPYTCATCVEADNYEGEIKHVSDWPPDIFG